MRCYDQQVKEVYWKSFIKRIIKIVIHETR